jgi:hypothetical protein
MLADFPDPTLAQVVGCGVVQTTKKKRNNVSLLVLAKKRIETTTGGRKSAPPHFGSPPLPPKRGRGVGGGKQPLEYNYACLWLSLENQKNARPFPSRE